MRELIRLFTQIALLRRGPQDVPASPLLLVLTVVGYLCVNFVLWSVLPAARGWSAPLLVATLFTLLWYVGLLRLVGRPERTLQTATAVFGLQTVLSPPLVVSEWLMRRVPDGSGWQLPIACAGLALVVWLIAANSHVVRAALEWSATSSVVLVVMQVFAGELLLLALFPPGNS